MADIGPLYNQRRAAGIEPNGAANDFIFEKPRPLMPAVRNPPPAPSPTPQEVMEDLPALSVKQARALAELLSQPTLTDAARAAEIGERTLRGWIVEDKVFAAHYQNARREMFSRQVKSLLAYTPQVSDELFKIVMDNDLPGRARLAASRTLLEFGFRGAQDSLVTQPGEKAAPEIEYAEQYRKASGSVRRQTPDKLQILPLTEPQEKALVAMIAHPTITEAAKAAGVGLRTLQHWLSHHVNFMAHYDQARRVVFEEIMKKVQDRVPVVIEQIYEMMRNQSYTTGVRIAAARTILIYARRGGQLLSASEQIYTSHEAAMAQQRKLDLLLVPR